MKEQIIIIFFIILWSVAFLALIVSSVFAIFLGIDASTCKYCDSKNQTEAYCTQCGHNMYPICGNCNIRLNEKAKFCPECGRATTEYEAEERK